MTTTRHQLNKKGPTILVSEQESNADPVANTDPAPPHITPEANNQDESNLSMPALDEEEDLWVRLEHINEKTDHALSQLQEAQQKVHQKLQESS